jgi:hypothetical protein
MDKRKMTNRNLHLGACNMQWQCYALPAGVELFDNVKEKTFG